MDAELFFADSREIPSVCCVLVQLRTPFRLRPCPVPHDTVRRVETVRFEETINGRHYIIEVSAVERDRWRAQILRKPGAVTALMPFYGATALEASRLLCNWLTRAAAGTNS